MTDHPFIAGILNSFHVPRAVVVNMIDVDINFWKAALLTALININ